MGVPNGRIYEGGGGPEWTELRDNRGSRMDVENSIESLSHLWIITRFAESP